MIRIGASKERAVKMFQDAGYDSANYESVVRCTGRMFTCRYCKEQYADASISDGSKVCCDQQCFHIEEVVWLWESKYNSLPSVSVLCGYRKNPLKPLAWKPVLVELDSLQEVKRRLIAAAVRTKSVRRIAKAIGFDPASLSEYLKPRPEGR